MENTSDLEIPNSSDSLSQLTEPPDIRNWFPSYKYETFVLDTYDACGGSALEESENEGDGETNKEKEGNSSESTTNGDSDDKYEDQSLSRMTDSTCSLSPPSEPPFIGNWYSSYMYESPLLDSAVDDCKGLVIKEKEYEKEVFDSEANKRKREDILDESENTFEDMDVNKPSNEITDSPQPSLILSEAPNIKNWFSSYVYESPEIDGLADTENECEEDGYVDEHNNNKEKETSLCKFGQTKTTNNVSINEKVLSNGCVKFNSSSRDNEQENHILSEGIRLPVNGHLSTQDNLAFGCDNSQRLAENLNKAPQTKVVITSPASNMKLNQAAIDLIRISSHGNNDKENEVKEVLENGFVTTKKNRQIRNDENYLHRPEKNLSDSTRNKRPTSSECRSEAIRRKVLSERTNLENTNAIEFAGKWKCPQKTKPNVGPPLKQLGLERWIHRL